MAENSPHQSEFKILDMGAGKFQWINQMVKSFDKEHPNKKLVAYGLSAESCENGPIKIGNSEIIPLCSFKTEDIIKSFKTKGLDLSNSFDLIVSRFVFTHLIEPIGTLQQVISTLKPETGVLLTDSFDFMYLNNDGSNVYPYHESKTNPLKLYNLLSLTLGKKIDYLMCPNFNDGELEHFAIQKSGELDELSIGYRQLSVNIEGKNINLKNIKLTHTSERTADIEIVQSMKLINGYQVSIPMTFKLDENSCGKEKKYIGSKSIFDLFHQDDLMVTTVEYINDEFEELSYSNLGHCNSLALLVEHD